MTSIETTQTLLETIDLTGQQPIVDKKIVQKTIQVHHLDPDDGDVKMSSTNITKPQKSAVIDRRLQSVSYSPFRKLQLILL